MSIYAKPNLERSLLSPEELTELLHFAVRTIDIVSVEELLYAHADVPLDKQNESGKTVAHSAVDTVIANLLKAHEMKFEWGIDFATPLNILKVILQQGCASVKTREGKSLLHCAVDINWIKVLQNRNVDTDNQWPGYVNAAIRREQIEDLLQILLAHGCDINAQDCTGRAVLQLAIEKNNSDAVNFLMKKGCKIHSKLIYIAVLYDRPLFVKLLLENMCDKNTIYKNGDTILHVAIKKNASFLTCMYLILYGTDVRRTNNWGKTILHILAAGGNVDLFKFIASVGCDGHAFDCKGRRVSQLANGVRRRMLQTIIRNECV